MSITLGDIAKAIGADVHGDSSLEIQKLATLDQAGSGDLGFLFDRSYRKFLKVTQASAIILSQENLADCPVSALVMSNPYLGYAKSAQLIAQQQQVTRTGIHPSACVSPTASIPESAWVGANAVIEEDVILGDSVSVGAGCVIYPNVRVGDHSILNANITVYQDVHIGHHCIIHAGTVIGSDGFGYAKEGDAWVKIPQLGSVQIGDHVEIGANTTIDRGALKDTVIGNGVIIDNLVQIAHNVTIGDHSAVAGCTGISGSTQIGKRCAFGGGVGLSGHMDICDDVTVTGMSMITKSIKEPGTYSSGWPAQEARLWRRRVARFNRLDKKRT